MEIKLDQLDYELNVFQIVKNLIEELLKTFCRLREPGNIF